MTTVVSDGGGKSRRVRNTAFIRAVEDLGSPTTREVSGYVNERTPHTMDEATAHRRLGILAVEDRLVKRKDDEQARWLTEELFEDVCPDTKIMYAIEESGGLATTGEVASQTCFTEPAIAGRLRDLEDDGVLISGGPGGSIDVETSPRVSLPVVSKEKEAVFYWALTSSRA